MSRKNNSIGTGIDPGVPDKVPDLNAFPEEGRIPPFNAMQGDHLCVMRVPIQHLAVRGDISFVGQTGYGKVILRFVDILWAQY
jgi:hypothetical protein